MYGISSSPNSVGITEATTTSYALSNEYNAWHHMDVHNALWEYFGCNYGLNACPPNPHCEPQSPVCLQLRSLGGN